MRSLRVKAPAKINLFLRVLGRRPDGYHDIETVFQAIELHDELIIKATGEEFSLDVPGHPDLENDQNLVAKAFRLLEKETGRQLPVAIQLFKKIPAAGGLGGGSSDCAATLLAVRELFGLEVSDARLSELARSLGADVPFFLVGGTAVAEGIGEVLTPVRVRSDYRILLVNPRFPVPTRSVYQEFSRNLTGKSRESTVWKVLETRSAAEDLLCNDLQGAAEALFPEIADIRSAMNESGLHKTLMSGSGPTVFALGEQDILERAQDGQVRRWHCISTGPWQRGITFD
jgi:4-diphosphocytidyl-2-C-methyl-D-erythritol kinase